MEFVEYTLHLQCTLTSQMVNLGKVTLNERGLPKKFQLSIMLASLYYENKNYCNTWHCENKYGNFPPAVCSGFNHWRADAVGAVEYSILILYLQEIYKLNDFKEEKTK